MEPTDRTPSALDPTAAAAADEIVVATYNVAALFDTTKDPDTQDHEYLPHGWYNWTEERFARKLANIARLIRAINASRGPDILCLNEVENRPPLERLRDAHLADLGNQTFVLRDTACAYGLDHALLSRFALDGQPQLHEMHLRGAEPARRTLARR